MKVAIVGGAPNTWELAPFDDSAWEIWVLGNQINRYADKRVDRIFEVHDNLSEHPEHYKEMLESQNKPVVVGENTPVNGEVFPFDRARALMDGDYLTSSPAYMMAYAILEGAEAIGIYGVEMAVDDHEYFKQRPAMYAWIAYAKGLGVGVHIPPESGLFREPYVEGRDWNGGVDRGVLPFTETELAKMEQQHLAKISECEEEITALQGRIQAHNGAAQAYNRMAKVARALEGGADVKSLTDSVRVR